MWRSIWARGDFAFGSGGQVHITATSARPRCSTRWSATTPRNIVAKLCPKTFCTVIPPAGWHLGNTGTDVETFLAEYPGVVYSLQPLAVGARLLMLRNGWTAHQVAPTLRPLVLLVEYMFLVAATVGRCSGESEGERSRNW